jgi:hypothetical protein
MEHTTVDRFGREQRGLVTLAQWQQAGGSERGWYRAIRSGRLVAVHRGVARLPGAADSARARIHAALLAIDDAPTKAARPRAVASHTSAALLHAAEITETTVHLTLLRPGTRPNLDEVVLHRPTDAGSLAIVRADGLAATTPARTLLDCAAILGRPQLEGLLDTFLIAKLVSLGPLERLARAQRRQGKRGARVLAEVVAEAGRWAKPPDSVLEVAFADLIASHGLPLPIFHRVVSARGRSFELDFAYEGGLLPLDLEVDGWASHGSARAFDLNRERDAILQSAGWVVQRFTWFQVINQPDFVVGVVRDLLQRHGYIGLRGG